MTKIEDSFEYHCEKAKEDFQVHLNGLLEAHADFLHKITLAKGNKKAGIWLEMSEAEIVSGHILECITNLMGDYKIVSNTNKLLSVNYQASQRIIRKDLRSFIQDFKQDRITHQQFSEHLDDFVGTRKPIMKAG